MTWNYSGRPEENEKDKVRFLVGDTCPEDPLVQDEEIEYALSEFPRVTLAAALVCRSLASRYSRMVSSKVGDISVSGGDKIAEAYKKRAEEFDPDDLTAGRELVLPSFGGLTHSGKETLNEDTDAVQPSFQRGMNDIPGGPSDDVVYSTEEDDLIL